jgi:hypothetical protein
MRGIMPQDKQSDGPGRPYVRRVHTVTLRDGSKVSLPFIAHSAPVPLEYMVNDVYPERGNLSLEALVIMAKSYIDHGSMTPRKAAEMVARDNIEAEGLSPEQAEELIMKIHATLNNE